MCLHDAPATIRPSTFANAERIVIVSMGPENHNSMSPNILVRLIGMCKKQKSARASDLGELRGMHNNM